ncbi:YciI-like protein [Pokkaliibacter sp. MBI-7]|uniref:YciI-like protein n=1 Tax=Pokkaliibacter sp. MBI-7 TaxID=3040600 RepID=UPI0024482D0C|nr:YciI-like protein [Pokkaliibacter sp. MBI-7]MDH2435502.1 YciI-like protein [Pokkaliibacter sp. MBI-7]
MKHVLLTYDYVDDYLEQRGQYRQAHLAHCEPFLTSGQLVLGGAITEGPMQGVMVFKVTDVAEVEAFAGADPYVINGLVRQWQAREWFTVVGEQALHPIPPG